MNHKRIGFCDYCYTHERDKSKKLTFKCKYCEKYFKPGRKIVKWAKKKIVSSGGGVGDVLGLGNVGFGGGNILGTGGGPLTGMGDPFVGINTGGPFGGGPSAPKRHHKRKAKVKVVYRYRPRRRYYYR